MSPIDIDIPVQLQDQVNVYLNHLTIERGLSDNTMAAYRRDLKRYLTYLAQERVSDVNNISAHHVTGFLQALSSGSHHMGQLADSSINRTLIDDRGWNRFMFLDITTDIQSAATT